MDGSIRIGWDADGYSAIRVYARRRPQDELLSFGSRVGDVALLNRTVPDLHAALRAEFDATFDLDPRGARGDGEEPFVLVSLHPPPGEPNPDETGWDEWS